MLGLAGLLIHLWLRLLLGVLLGVGVGAVNRGLLAVGDVGGLRELVHGDCGLYVN